jgi:hypothetical protein
MAVEYSQLVYLKKFEMTAIASADTAYWFWGGRKGPKLEKSERDPTGFPIPTKKYYGIDT